MKKSRGSPATLLWARLLIIGSLAPVVGQAAADDEMLSVEVDEGLISVVAYDVSVGRLIETIATVYDLVLVQHADLERTISIDIEEQPMPDLLADLLRNDSYQLYLPPADGDDTEIPGTLWIFAEGAVEAPVATVFLEAVLFEGSDKEKLSAIRELRRQSSTTAVRSLSLALSDEDPRIRDAAIEALENIGSDEAMAAIASAAMDSDPWLRSEAVTALASGDSATSTAYLTTALNDPDPRVRMSVLEALADVPMGTVPDQQAITALNLALKDPDPDVRMQAMESLEEIGGDVAYQALMQAKRDQDARIAEEAEASMRNHR